MDLLERNATDQKSWSVFSQRNAPLVLTLSNVLSNHLSFQTGLCFVTFYRVLQWSFLWIRKEYLRILFLFQSHGNSFWSAKCLWWAEKQWCYGLELFVVFVLCIWRELLTLPMAQIGDLMPLIELIVISMLVSIFRNSVVSDLDNFLR